MEGDKSKETNGSQTEKSNVSISDRSIPFTQETTGNRSKESESTPETICSLSLSSENVRGTELKILRDSAKVSQSDEPPLLGGELIQGIGRDVKYLCPYNGQIKGALTVTNYKLYFKSSERESLFILDVPLGVISKIEKISNATSRGDNSYGINLICKDIRNLRFAHQQENHSRGQVFEKIQQFAFPITNKQPLFAFEFKEDYGDDGWKVYDPIAEYNRQGLSNDSWKINKINERYELCETYPSIVRYLFNCL
ncbi:myotubularin-related protein 2-like [Mytilus trossulus]|uniref:myotubularin-related protein 2-like n=1 Tax=Mytilus trossulus TaxID=6551 RepID=UPI00300718CC